MVMLLGHQLLGLGLATALLLAGSLAPTDPVLAGDVQIEHDENEEEAEAKFALTSEAGLNDALAFPFIHLAIAIAAAGSLTGAVLGDWVLNDVLWKLGAGLVVGAALGWLVGMIIYHLPSETRLSRTGDGFIALGTTLAVYTATEFAHGYGFLAVFVAGLMIRRAAQGHDFNKRLHDFADESERLLMMLLLVLFGGMLAAGLLNGLGWQKVAFAAIMLLIIRPLAGWISLLGVKRPKLELAIISFFGIRGLGSVLLSELRLQSRHFPIRIQPLGYARAHHRSIDRHAWCACHTGAEQIAPALQSDRDRALVSNIGGQFSGHTLHASQALARRALIRQRSETPMTI